MGDDLQPRMPVAEIAQVLRGEAFMHDAGAIPPDHALLRHAGGDVLRQPLVGVMMTVSPSIAATICAALAEVQQISERPSPRRWC